MSSSPKCSFCGRPKNEVRSLVGGNSNKEGEESAFICDRCVETAFGAVQAGSKTSKTGVVAKKDPIRKPKDIKTFLDEYVIAQDHAKTDLAVAIYNHYKRRDIVSKKMATDVEVDKANILLLGPTGTGKTHLARTIAKMLNVPFYVGDATRLTQAGYVGDDVESLLQGLVQDAGGDIERAEWGLIYLDEIDKIARSSGRERAGYRDVSGEGVQQALLKLLEGSRVSIQRQGGKGIPGMAAMDTIDTKNILFICAGSFAGIEENVRRRMSPRSQVGFHATERKKFETLELYQYVNEQDILDFGIIPEMKGRLPVMTSTYELSEEDMVKVLSEPKNSIIKQVQYLFSIDNVDLQFEKDALLAIAREAKKQPMGARALRSIVEKVTKKLAFDVPSDVTIETIVITEGTVTGTGEPMIKYRIKEVEGDVEAPAVEEAKRA